MQHQIFKQEPVLHAIKDILFQEVIVLLDNNKIQIVKNSQIIQKHHAKHAMIIFIQDWDYVQNSTTYVKQAIELQAHVSIAIKVTVY